MYSLSLVTFNRSKGDKRFSNEELLVKLSIPLIQGNLKLPDLSRDIHDLLF